ncbi:LCP family protein [Microlunatus sp. Y2014]|uniref:LCP family protein n=1 Tax=Microlunatus sp. Y2014 TaxID=3418488 RepID=UPI003DA76B1F
MAGRDDDLDWLYRKERSQPAQPEGTRVFSPEELAELRRQSEESGQRGTRAQQAHAAQQEQRRVKPAPAPPPQPPPKPPRRRGSGVRRFFGGFVLVIAALIAYLLIVPLIAWSSVEHADDQPPGERPGDQPGRTYLLVGSDSREGLSEEERKKLGTGDAEGQRTDTIMVLFVPPGGRPALISIPRDSYVAIPGHGQNKINAAYAFGGPELLTQTVEQATGLRIDHYMEIGFGGFVNVIDAVNGIEMCVPRDIKDEKSHLDVKKGCQTMDGVTALAYVRMRYADPEGDLGRVKRQREMVAAVADKVASPMNVINPVRYWNLNHAVADSVRLGETTSMLDLVPMGLAVPKLTGPDALALTVPIAGNVSTDAGAALAWDEEKCADMFGTIARGSTEGLEQYAKP